MINPCMVAATQYAALVPIRAARSLFEPLTVFKAPSNQSKAFNYVSARKVG